MIFKINGNPKIYYEYENEYSKNFTKILIWAKGNKKINSELSCELNCELNYERFNKKKSI